MSQENVEIVRRMYEAFNDEGVAGTLDYYADEIVWHSDPRFPGGGTYKGKERAAEYMQSLIDYWEHIELRVEELIPKGDQVLAILTSHNVGREGVTMDSFWAHLWTVADGKMQDVRSFLDREAALQAAGLSE